MTPAELQPYNSPLIYLEVSNTTFFGYSVYCFNGAKVQILTLLPAVVSKSTFFTGTKVQIPTLLPACSAPDDYQRIYRRLPQSYLIHNVEVDVGRSYAYVYSCIYV